MMGVVVFVCGLFGFWLVGRNGELRRKGKIFGLNAKVCGFGVENSIWGSIEYGFGILKSRRGEK